MQEGQSHRDADAPHVGRTAFAGPPDDTWSETLGSDVRGATRDGETSRERRMKPWMAAAGVGGLALLGWRRMRRR